MATKSGRQISFPAAYSDLRTVWEVGQKLLTWPNFSPCPPGPLLQEPPVSGTHTYILPLSSAWATHFYQESCRVRLERTCPHPGLPSARFLSPYCLLCMNFCPPGSLALPAGQPSPTCPCWIIELSGSLSPPVIVLTLTSILLNK